MAIWYIPLQVKDKETDEPLGIWHMTEQSDEDSSLFRVLCDPDECEHTSSEEAQDCPIANSQMEFGCAG